MPEAACYSVSDSSDFGSPVDRHDLLGSTPPPPALATTESLRAMLDLALRALEVMTEPQAPEGFEGMDEIDPDESGLLVRTLSNAGGDSPFDWNLFDWILDPADPGFDDSAACALWVQWMLARTGVDASPKVREALTALTAGVTEAQRESAEQRFEALWNAGEPLDAGRGARLLRARSPQV